MSLKHYVKLWILLSIVMAFENYALNQHPEWSLLAWAKPRILSFRDLNLSPQAGKQISWYLGWTGFIAMCLSNLYSMRKRIGLFKKMGSVGAWLDFHIFCGLFGPTCILFHTNFKIGGLVAISFWSMVVSFASGIVGRYFYMQLGEQQGSLVAEKEHFSAQLNLLARPHANLVSAENLMELKDRALQFVGITINSQNSILGAFFNSLIGDFRLMFSSPATHPALPKASSLVLREYALRKRKIIFMDHFQVLMGHWHAFHLPFAVFMYFIAFIHIVTALLFTTSMK